MLCDNRNALCTDQPRSVLRVPLHRLPARRGEARRGVHASVQNGRALPLEQAHVRDLVARRDREGSSGRLAQPPLQLSLHNLHGG